MKYINNLFAVYSNVFKGIPEIIIQFIRYGACAKRIYYVNVSKKLVYLNMAKAGCTSFVSSLLEQGHYTPSAPTIIHQIGTGHKIIELNKKDGFEDYYFFSYVRNPFERIVSCYKDKIVQVNTYYRKSPLEHWKMLADCKDFDDFIDKIALIPDILAEQHFRSQYSTSHKNGKLLLDFVGHLESSQETYSKFVEEYDLSPLENHNSTKKDNWMDYYTLASAKKVYRRYKNDVIKFGYTDEYKKLISYLKRKNSKR